MFILEEVEILFGFQKDFDAGLFFSQPFWNSTEITNLKTDYLQVLKSDEGQTFFETFSEFRGTRLVFIVL